MDSRLSAALRDLEAECQRLGAPLGSIGMQGAAEAEVRQGFESLGLVPIDELLTWFQWHNGWAEYCATPDNPQPYDLATATDHYWMMRTIAEDVGGQDGREAIESVWR